ncbi:hypothetical protein AB0F46_29430 [Streptomyces sp. NPDC026665]|uniref:3'-5' exonuclease n=1 Tax=Streptomyces sp. NPDC026665 TaxID=3154798 RepID=UPI0033DDEF64
MPETLRIPYPIAFIDTETTHLSAEIGEAWEVAVILREDGDPFTDTEYAWQIRPDLTTADPEALSIGRYEERFAVRDGAEAAFTGYGAVDPVPMSRAEVVEAIVRVLRGAVLVGSNPAFDERFLRKLVGLGGAQWHYRPYDIVQLAAVKLGVQAAGPLPWRTHVLSRAVGVEPPAKNVAHTALGDARWARDVHDAVMVKAQLPLTWEGRAQHAIGLYTETAIELEDALGVVAQRDAAIERARKLATQWAVLRAYGGAARELRAVLDDQEPNVLPTGFRPDTVVAVKCAVCEYEFDEDESYTVHFLSVEHAHQSLRDHGWTILDDGRAVCDHDDAEHLALLPPVDDPSEPVAEEQVDADVDDVQEAEDLGDSDSDVLALISDIAGRLSDATDEGEYHAVNLIGDLANGRKTIAEARAELAEITFRHV